MIYGYSGERLALFEDLFKRRPEAASGRFWTLEPRHLRFRHGESITELKVPYHMGADDEACIEKAVLSLVSLLMKRYEPVRTDTRKDSSQVLPVPVPVLKDKTFRTDIFIADSPEKKLAIDIVSSIPNIDTAIIYSWLSSDGHGRAFMKWVGSLFEKALKDETQIGGAERTSYIALLAAVNTIRKKKERIKEFRIKGLSYEKLELTIGMTLFMAFRHSVSALLKSLKAEGSPCYSEQSESLLLSAIAPKSFLSIPSNLLSTSINPYRLNNDTFEALYEVLPEINGPDMAALAATAAERIKNRADVIELIRTQNEITRFRDEALKYLTEFDHSGEAQDTLYELYNDDRLIKNFLNDQRASASLGKALEDVKKRYAKDIQKVETAESFIEFLASYKKSVLGGFLKGSKKEAYESASSVIGDYCALRLDDNVERFASLMRGCLLDRRGEFNQNMLIEEYNRGRLYRISTDDRPILKTLEKEEEAQLFIDMKDFTRKTLKVKEIAMAEFMKEYFYKPILSAASRYGLGAGVLSADERGIRLTNLPGDAAIFSGGVTNLVNLARDIQLIIRRYREHLLRKLPPGRNEEILEEVHRRFSSRKDSLKEKRDDLNRALEANEDGIESRLVALGEEEHKLENIYRDELENAIKGELEAGLYISYGSKAEIIMMEQRQEFSPAKVSIGEKINEASRGTFRNPLVRAKLEVLLENEKQNRKNKNLKYPFDIYIDRIYSFKMPPELDTAFEKLIANRKTASAQAMAQIMGNKFLSDLTKIISGEPFSSLRLVTVTTDIYNKGEALSVDALKAYINESKGTKRFFRKTVNVSELDQSIREEFFFPASQLELWFGFEKIKGIDYIEAFYKSGEIIFKGFEASVPMVIYEMINTEGDFFRALLNHHFPKWHEDAAARGYDKFE